MTFSNIRNYHIISTILLFIYGSFIIRLDRKNIALLSDAKFRKDVLKDFVGDDGAAGGDGTESVDDLADLFAQQVGGKPVAQACLLYTSPSPRDA